MVTLRNSFYPKSVIKISLPFNLYLRPYCDRFAEGIADYVGKQDGGEKG